MYTCTHDSTTAIHLEVFVILGIVRERGRTNGDEKIKENESGGSGPACTDSAKCLSNPGQSRCAIPPLPHPNHKTPQEALSYVFFSSRYVIHTAVNSLWIS